MIRFDGHTVTAALFDMDGTMFDTERLRFETIRQAAREISGVDFSDEVLIGSLGLSARRAEALAKSHYGEAFAYAAIRKRADELELAHVRRHGVPVKPGLPDILERLRKNGIRLAVATSSRRAIALEYLINADVYRYFDAVVCGDEVENGKPHPEIFLAAAQAVGCEMDEALIVEDSANGLRAATAAGGKAVYIRDIKDPPADLLAACFRRYDSTMDFLADLRLRTRDLPEPRLFDPFPSARNGLRVGIHGFGAIGGGLLAQVFSHWDGYTRPSEIVGVTGDALTRELVNAVGRYTTRYDAHGFDQVIGDIRLIDSADEAAVVELYATSALMGLALPEQAIPGVAGLIARGLIERHRRGTGPLIVLTILNKIGGSAFVERALRAALDRLAPDLAGEIMAQTRFPEAMVNRIVSRVPAESLARQARIKLRPFLRPSPRVAPPASEGPRPAFREGWLETACDRLRQTALQAKTLERVHFVLFHSEPDMTVFAARGEPLLAGLRQLRLVEDIGKVQMLKNRLWNGSHAVLAWYGDLLGHATIGQAIADPRVADLVRRLTEEEIGPSLARAMPELAPSIRDFIRIFTDRCAGSFSDTCRRVGRDPLRKLQRDERILGSIFAARRAGIRSEALEFGVVLALRYALRHDDEKECRLIRDIYARRNRIEDVLTATGRIEGRPMPGLDPVGDADLIARIKAGFEAFSPGALPLPDPARGDAGARAGAG
ncbi:bifunctional mannitol-1-phosphate dehydrogenase/phosphatase [Pseudogemmobacter sonorensis]|uniref:bifunctional mannitol-1-phosphate dehydrogenase/phosphatase n=1 Tax=Pseudogemmobacter sonorensis TaxID=2989681 RepID=UPI0036A59FA0